MHNFFSRVKIQLLDLLGFMRFEKSFFTAFAGVLGFVFFNPLSANLFFAALSAFFIVSASRACNNLTDTKEDLLNKKKLNPLAINKAGLFIVAGLFLAGLIFSFFLSLVSTFFYLAILPISLVYSFFRLKARFLIKNIVSGLVLVSVFLIGAGFLSAVVLAYSFLFFLFVFGASLVSDLNDFKGDKQAGLRTVPVVLGLNNTRKIICLIFLVFLFLAFYFGKRAFFVLVFPAFIILFSVAVNRTTHTFRAGGLSLPLSVAFFFLFAFT